MKSEMRGSTEAKKNEDSDEKEEDKIESPLMGRNVWAAKSISNVEF